MNTANRRVGEKGQRTPRSMEVYEEKGGAKGGAFCRCGVVFQNKRWYRSEGESARQEGQELVCPACRRIADRNPAGIITLSGDFYAAHEAEIRTLVDKTVQSENMKNPLGRVMDIQREQDGVTITTTDEKLSQKIGREVFKSHGGELHFIWSHSGSPVRVVWSR